MTLKQGAAGLWRAIKASFGRVAFVMPPGVGRLDHWVVGLLLPSAALLALLFVAPAMLPPNATGDLSGRVGLVDNARVWSSFPEPAQWTYYFGDVACHTKSARSFFINGNQMPVCARDVAIFLGITAGLALAISPRSRLYRLAVTLPWWMYFVLLAPIAVDGGAQDVLGFESDNLRRLLTGFPAGIAVALALVFVVYEGRFAVARWHDSRARRRGQDSRGRPQAEGDSSPGASTTSLGSKPVESAPMEKKNMLHP